MVTSSYSPRSGSPLGRALSLIESPHPDSRLRFLILDCPTESTLSYYLEAFQGYNVTNVVRCCQPTYPTARLAEHGIKVHDMPFKDGDVPPLPIILEWRELVMEQERLAKDADPNLPDPTIAVHCVAGLGRAPALVAIALIELGMAPLDAIAHIRSKRRGAFNKPQINFLDSYKRFNKSKSSSATSLRVSLGKMFKFGNSGNANKKEVAIH